MTVLVTGATGFVGSAVVRALLARGARVRVLTRPGSDRRNLEGLDIEAMEGDLLQPGTLKPLLLNQTFLAGVGNIYADEALWLAQIDPRRKADTLEAGEIERLYDAIRQALSSGIQHEGATIGWYRKPDGTSGESQNHFNVYDRADEACLRCGEPVHKVTLGQRGTHFCPACQR